MRRWLLVALMVLLPAVQASAKPVAVQEACTQQAKNVEGVKALIRCAAPRLGLSTEHAMYVAWRESRYHPGQRNGSSSACGVYQFVDGTWHNAVRWYLYGHQLGPEVCTNGRMNVILALRWASDRGWDPWQV